MRRLVMALFFTALAYSQSPDQLESGAELLERQASNLARIADNEIKSASLAEKQADEAARQNDARAASELRREAERRRQKAAEALETAKARLERASELRRLLIKQEEISAAGFEKPDTLRIASWNIQNFGESKKNRTVAHQGREKSIPELIADIIRAGDFAAVAIQEVEGENLEAMEAIVERLNKNGEIYRMTYPEKIGKSSNRAEYLPIIYNDDLLKFQTQGMLKDTEMQRAPHYAFFSARPEKFQAPAAGKKHFDFVLVSVHLSPKATGAADLPRQQDFAQLPKIFNQLRKKFGDGEDIVVAGDFNCDPGSAGIDGYLWRQFTSTKLHLHPPVMAGEIAPKSMVQGDRLNDNIIWQNSTEEDWAKVKTLVDFPGIHFDGDIEAARKISDHLPIWCQFYANRDTD